MPAFPRSLVEFQRQCPDETACKAWLAEQRWPEGFACPACGGRKAWALKTKAATFAMRRLRQADVGDGGNDLARFETAAHRVVPGGVLHGDAFERHLGAAAKSQLALGSCKSAWLLCAKLRRAIADPARSALSGLVDVDETAIACRSKDDPVTPAAKGEAVRASSLSPAPSIAATGRGASASARSRTVRPTPRRSALHRAGSSHWNLRTGVIAAVAFIEPP